MLRGLPSLRAMPAWVGQLPLENLTVAACGPLTRLHPLTQLTALRSLVLQARPLRPQPQQRCRDSTGLSEGRPCMLASNPLALLLAAYGSRHARLSWSCTCGALSSCTDCLYV